MTNKVYRPRGRGQAPDLSGPDMTLLIPARHVSPLVKLARRHGMVCAALATDARHVAMFGDLDVARSGDDVVFTLQRRDVRWMAMLAGMLVMRDAGVSGGGIFEMLQGNAMHARWFVSGEDAVPVPLPTTAVARLVRVTAERHAVGAGVLWAAITWYLVGAMMKEYRDACLRIVRLDRHAGVDDGR